MTFSKWQHMLWIMLIAIMIAGVAGTRASDKPAPSYRWFDIRDRGSANALSTSDWLLTPDHQALIWHPQDSDTPLTYTPLDEVTLDAGLIPYPNLHPRRWQTAPAEANTFHLVWQEENRRLLSAQIGAEGQTIRGPIELASRARSDFVALPYQSDRLLVLWVQDSTSHLIATDIDRSGRPVQQRDPLLDRVSFMAATADQANMIHLVWLTSSEPDGWIVNYQAASADNLVFDNPDTVHTFALKPDETLTSLTMGLDTTHVYLFWSTSTADGPDVERVYVLAFPLDRSGEPVVQELMLPQRFVPDKGLTSSDLTVGRVAPIPNAPDEPADLRWLRPASGQRTILPLALTLRTPDGWRPAVVYFQGGKSLGFQIVAPHPADAGPPTLAVDPAGDLYLAWLGLTDLVPHVYTATTNGQGLITISHTRNETATEALASALARLPLGLIWLVIPTCIVLVAPGNTWTLPLAIALYGVGKLFWPLDLFDHMPPLLNTMGLDRLKPGLAVGLTVLVITLVSGSMLSLARRSQRPPWLIWLAFALPDALLTWIIFGANVSGLGDRLWSGT